MHNTVNQYTHFDATPTPQQITTTPMSIKETNGDYTTIET